MNSIDLHSLCRYHTGDEEFCGPIRRNTWTSGRGRQPVAVCLCFSGKFGLLTLVRTRTLRVTYPLCGLVHLRPVGRNSRECASTMASGPQAQRKRNWRG